MNYEAKSVNHEVKPTNEVTSMKPPSGVLRHKQKNNQPIANKNKVCFVDKVNSVYDKHSGSKLLINRDLITVF